ncbi:hypothetical protein SOCE26_020070 [Sorangium cellulosum]|uniref:Uncharacterized protein n=1 Tax=Sorangium cellulosum TaxID=56 RepID=A0A2L0EMT6_SORCE|nr:hypothetical protein [Sorangium cellulosum]AUX40606.1 hypothetical protein SOCE26_020070 [Sorangium cellulosum]
MRLIGQIHITLKGSIVQRNPTVWEKFKRGFGARVDLDTDRMRVELEATAVVDQVKRALGRLGVGNALSLVIDDTVIFQDTDGKPDDLPDLMLALSEHASLFGRGFRELRFAAEHEEAGLHLVIETRARTEHLQDEPAALVSIGGRVQDLEPRRGESGDEYRRRVEPLTKDAALFEAARLQFESFVGRLEDALKAAMPEARVEQHHADARVVHAPDGDGAAPHPVGPTHPGYDPFMVYYPPSPLGMMLDVMLISSFMHMLSPPHIFVVNPAGATLGTAQEAAANPDVLNAADRGGGDDEADDGGDDEGGDDGDPWTDDGGGDDGGGDLGDFGD